MKDPLKDALMIISDGCLSAEQNRIFNQRIRPFFDMVINNVFYSLDIFPDSFGHDKYNDLKQEIYLMLLSRLNKDRLIKIRDIESYTFISVRNKTLNFIRNQNKKDHMMEVFRIAITSDDQPVLSSPLKYKL